MNAHQKRTIENHKKALVNLQNELNKNAQGKGKYFSKINASVFLMDEIITLLDNLCFEINNPLPAELQPVELEW